MKKLLLVFFISYSLATFAQPECFTIGSTGWSTNGAGITSMSAPTDNIVWIARPSSNNATPPVITNREIGVSTDGGVTFTPKVCVFPPATGNALAISSICGLSSTVGYVACNGAGDGVWKTTDAGTTWTKQTTALFNDPDSFNNFVYFWDANNGVTMGDPAGGYFEIYTTTNGGTNWVRTGSAAIPAPVSSGSGTTFILEAGLTNQFTVTGNTLWLGTTFGRILKTTDKGLTWTAINTPVPGFSGGPGTNAPANFNANQDWKSDLVGTITDNEFNYYRTADGGTTWVQDVNGIPLSFDFAYVPGSVSTVVCTGEDVDKTSRFNAYSFDDGLTWTQCAQQNGSYGGIYEIRSPTVGWLSGFTVSSSVGGIWRMTGSQLPTQTFSADKLFTATPNPTSNKLDLSGANINQVQITDILGKIVFNNNYSSLSNVELNIAEFTSGIYMVKVTNNEGISSVVKVVKQ